MTRSERTPPTAEAGSGYHNPADRPEPRVTARIAVDLLGGDQAPAVVVGGALRACGADPELHLHLVGPQDVADEILTALDENDRHRVSVSVSERVVAMHESPLRSARRHTTVRDAAELVYAGRVDAMMSAGSSGAAVTAAAHVLGRLPGVRRPPLAAVLPSAAGPVLLLDVGSGLDTTMLELVQNAVLGAAYAATALGVAVPRIGLLSVGSEPGKGDRLRRAVAVALTDLPLPAGGRYIGLVEGHDVPLGGPADVVLTDAFTGNVLLKGIEGAYALSGATRGPTERAAVLLGVAGTVVVCHGAATAADVASGIALAARLHRGNVLPTVADLADDLLADLSSADGLTIRDALGERS